MSVVVVDAVGLLDLKKKWSKYKIGSAGARLAVTPGASGEFGFKRPFFSKFVRYLALRCRTVKNSFLIRYSYGI